MRKNIQKFLIFSFLCLFLSGCQEEKTLLSPTATGQEMDSQITVIPISQTPTAANQDMESQIMETPVPPTYTTTSQNMESQITATPVFQQTEEGLLNEPIPSCQNLDIFNNDSVDLEYPGAIFYATFDKKDIYTLSGFPNVISTSLDTEMNFMFLGFSPDGEWLAYSQDSYFDETLINTIRIVLQSVNGEKIIKYFDLKDFESELQVGHQFIGVAGNSFWINPELIYITLYSQNPDPRTSGKIAEIEKVLNPFTGEWQNQYLDLPDQYLTKVAGISPDESLILYEAGGLGLSLWDYTQGRKIWHDDSIRSRYYGRIAWRPDGSIVAYASIQSSSNNHVVLISRNGESKLIVTENYPINEFIVFVISWSPDGNYLAIVGYSENDIYLYIYDVVSEKYILQCLYDEFTSKYPKVAWTPDSSVFAVSQPDSPMILIDIAEKVKINLEIEGRILGWSDRFTEILP